MEVLMRRVTAMLLLLYLAVGGPAWSAPFSQVIIFGDSLSDTGNVLEATNGLIPGPPYYNGRFSNGPTYAEVLTANLGGSAVSSIHGGTNYAFGGARTDAHFLGPFATVLGQVASYQVQTTKADPNALYIVFAGANNLQDAIMAAGSDPSNAAAIGRSVVTNAIDDLQSILTSLDDLGANNVLIPNVPDLGEVPRVLERGEAASQFATSLSLDFNQSLASLVRSEQQNLDIVYADTFSFVRGLIDNPGHFGLANVNSRCYSGDDLNFTGGGTLCQNPDAYLFWDGIHPTGSGQQPLGQFLTSAVVPEPATVLLVASGMFGLILKHRLQTRRPGPDIPASRTRSMAWSDCRWQFTGFRIITMKLMNLAGLISR
jgi:outer membrane lipase/esterase